MRHITHMSVRERFLLPLNSNLSNEPEPNVNDFYQEVPLIPKIFLAPFNFKRYWTEIFPIFLRSVKVSLKGLPLGSVRYRLFNKNFETDSIMPDITFLRQCFSNHICCYELNIIVYTPFRNWLRK